MRTTSIALIAVAILCVGVVAAFAQTPNIAVYFDENFKTMSADCPSAPAGTVFDQVYIVMKHFNAFVTAVEFRVDYPSELLWIGDTAETPLVIGNSADGCAVAYAPAENAYNPLLICTATVIWNCDGCQSANSAVRVRPYPSSGQVRAVRFPDNAVIEVIGMKSMVCSALPTDETNWGRIKSLYSE